MTEYYTSENGTKHKIGKHKGAWKPSKPSARELLDEYIESGWKSMDVLMWRQRMYVACHSYEGYAMITCIEPEIWAEYNLIAKAPKEEKRKWYREAAQAAKENNND